MSALTFTSGSVSTPQPVSLAGPVSGGPRDPVPRTAGVPSYGPVQVDSALRTLLGVAALGAV